MGIGEQMIEQDLRRAAYDALMLVLDAADEYQASSDDLSLEEAEKLCDAIDLLRNAAVKPE